MRNWGFRLTSYVFSQYLKHISRKRFSGYYKKIIFLLDEFAQKWEVNRFYTNNKIVLQLVVYIVKFSIYIQFL